MEKILNQITDDVEVARILIIASVDSYLVWVLNVHARLTLNAFGFIVLTASPLALGLTLVLKLAKNKKWDTIISLVQIFINIIKLFI